MSKFHLYTKYETVGCSEDFYKKCKVADTFRKDGRLYTITHKTPGSSDEWGCERSAFVTAYYSYSLSIK